MDAKLGDRRTGGDADRGGKADKHPSFALLDALRALEWRCSSAAKTLRNIASTRAEQEAVRANIRRMICDSATREAARMQASGAGLEATLGAVGAIIGESGTPPALRPGDDLRIDALLAAVPDALAWAHKAREAIRAGGADPLDANALPGIGASTRPSVRLAQAIRAAEHDLPDASLLMPAAMIGDQPDRLDAHAAGFKRTRAELVATLETRGIPAAEAESNPKAGRKRRQDRTEADKIRDEGVIAAYLIEHPDATRDSIAEATGISAAHVSASRAWKHRKADRKRSSAAQRPKGEPLDDLADPASEGVRSFADGGRGRVRSSGRNPRDDD